MILYGTRVPVAVTATPGTFIITSLSHAQGVVPIASD